MSSTFKIRPSLSYLVRRPKAQQAGRYAWFHVDFSSGRPLIVAEEAAYAGEDIYCPWYERQSIAVQHALDAVAYLQEKGVAPVYRSYDEGHVISARRLGDVVEWLE